MNYDCLQLNTDPMLQSFINREASTLKFYQNLEFNQSSIDEVANRPSHDHTEALANIIEEEMAPFVISKKQQENLNKLKNNHRVIIGGQQAGLLVSPQYILHKVYTIFILQKEVKEKYNYDAVPVFWIAGEDHDFEEVNHTYVYDKQHKRVKKVAYKPNLNVPMSVGFYEYDKKAMRKTFTEIIKMTGDSKIHKTLINDIYDMIDDNTYWTELFHAIVHALFKDDGLLIVNSHSKAIRALEQPFFDCLINESEQIDQAFRTGQADFNKETNTNPTIETDTDMHLFINTTTNRELVSSSTHEKQELLKLLNEAPHEFSNNVVTRPIMQEMLFNTLMFVGGGAEVKYWGEIYKVFEYLDMPMPIIMKRMEFMYTTESTTTYLQENDLTLGNDLKQQVAAKKESIIKKEIDNNVIKAIEDIREGITSLYVPLHKSIDKEKESLVKSNEENQLKQLDYLERRYKLEQKRKVRKELNKLDSICDLLFPLSTLQERKYHMFEMTNKMWEIPPLSYTTDLVLIKTL